MNEVYNYLKECGVYYLGTTNKDQPKLRPFGTIDLYEGKLYIQTGKIKNVSKQMKTNPKIEICAMNKATWIRLTAKAYLDESVEAQKHMLDQYPSLQKQYQPGDGNNEVFYLQEVTAVINAFGEEPKVYNF